MLLFERAQKALAGLDLIGANTQVAAYWLSRWQGDAPPARKDFDAAKDWEFTPAIALFAIRKDEDFRCIGAGAFHRLALGYDLVGESVLSITSAAEREERLAWCWEIVEGAVTVSYRRYRATQSALAQCMSLPFSDIDPDGTRYFLMHTNWRPADGDWISGRVQADAQAPPERLLYSFKAPNAATQPGDARYF